MRLLVTIILILVAAFLVFAAFTYDETPQQQEFRGTFVMGDIDTCGHLYQTEKEGQLI